MWPLAVVGLVGEALPDPGQALVAQLDEAERVDRAVGSRQAAGDAPLEHRGPAERYHGATASPGVLTGELRSRFAVRSC